MYKQKNKQRGITLIALVVSIIVLIILAGVSIAMLVGENGIITQAQIAAQETEQAQVEEQRQLAMVEAAMNTENQPYTDKNGDTVTIPAGFAVSQVEGENTIDDGLVIIDKNGNEFVWIPVSKENFNTQFQRRTGYYAGNLQSMTDYGEADNTGNNTNTEVTESVTTQKEAQEMYQSVYDNEGFYIGRYETGKDSSGNVVVQKGVSVYNNVTWSKNKTMNEEDIVNGTESNPDGAIELARKFYTESGYTDVTSTLCYGVQWDATLTWIDSEYTGFAKASTGKGNYNEDVNINSWKGNVALTGSSEDYKVNNIYDLAGNVSEWTMESYSTNCRVPRGGSYSGSGAASPASTRYIDYSPSDISLGRGFRITLYL